MDMYAAYSWHLRPKGETIKALFSPLLYGLKRGCFYPKRKLNLDRSTLYALSKCLCLRRNRKSNGLPQILLGTPFAWRNYVPASHRSLGRKETNAICWPKADYTAGLSPKDFSVSAQLDFIPFPHSRLPLKNGTRCR